MRVLTSVLGAALIAVAACGAETDTRPETADYIIEAILAPRCGRAACHSTTTKEHGYAFDTISAGIASMKGSGHGRALVVPGSPEQSQLVTILTDSNGPMPPDSPLPTADIELITRWVTDGAEGLE